MREMQVRRKWLAFSVRDLKGSLSHSETSYAVTTTKSDASLSGSTITIHGRQCEAIFPPTPENLHQAFSVHFLESWAAGETTTSCRSFGAPGTVFGKNWRLEMHCKTSL